jgi:membrane associated rhomboid family serine protease
MLYLFFPASDYFQPYQIISHMFMHSSVGHLFFNMLSLFFLGPYVERYLGSKKFLILYLASGFGAVVAHMGVDYYLYIQGALNIIPVVGASGAVYGVLLAFAYLFPDVKLMLLIPPIPVKAKYLALGLIAYDLYSGVARSGTGIAHFAHLGGAVTGILLAIYWQNNRHS